MIKGFVREVFTSIQGEGLFIGQRQTFVRFLGCNLSCNYCDTPEAQKMNGPFIYKGKIQQNPVAVAFLRDKISTDVVAITGGEPLLQVEFLAALCQNLKQDKKIVYLDTNGTLPDALEEVIKDIDIISLDFKISTATGRPKLWDEHSACLKIACAKKVFVKIVINENLLPDELEQVCNIMGNVDKNIPLVIQPVDNIVFPGLLDIQEKALKRLSEVRIIPQIHKFLSLK